MKAILLDLDGTLLDEAGAHREAFAALVDVHRARFEHAAEDDLFASWCEISWRHWRRYESGEVSFDEHRRSRARDFLGDSLTDDQADEAFEPYVRAYEAGWRLFPEVSEFLSRTAAAPKVIVTNGDRAQQLRKLSATGLSSHMSAVLTPDDCGCWKPSPEIFLMAAQAIGVDPRGCIMIGDNEEKDIVPARRLGMKSFHVVAGDPERTLLKALEAF